MSLALLQSMNIPGLNDVTTFNARDSWLFLLPIVILTVVAVIQLLLALAMKARNRPEGLGTTADTIITLIGTGLAFASTVWHGSHQFTKDSLRYAIFFSTIFRNSHCSQR